MIFFGLSALSLEGAAQIESSLEQPVIEEDLLVIYKGEACNKGASATEETSVMDMIHTPSEGVEEMKIYIGELDAGACVPWEHSSVIGEGIPPGSYELHLESGDFKSKTISYTVPQPGGLPDLKITILEVKTAGGEAQLVYQVCNEGTGPAGDFSVGLFLDGQPACEDKPFFKEPFSELLADACESYNSDVFTYEPAQVKVWAFVDYLCAVEEENDKNNITAKDLPLLSKEDPPDDPDDPDPADDPKQLQAPYQDGGCKVPSGALPGAPALFILLLLLIRPRPTRGDPWRGGAK